MIGAALGGAYRRQRPWWLATTARRWRTQIVNAGATTAGSMVASNALAEGQMNAAAWRTPLLADNTVLPGECVGGKVVVSFDIRGGAELYEVQELRGLHTLRDDPPVPVLRIAHP